MWIWKPLYWICVQWNFVNLRRIYRHPSGNASHFVSSLETTLTKLDDRKNAILAGDMNIDLIKYTNESVTLYMSTMMSYRYLPYVMLLTCITQLSTACIDHIFLKKNEQRESTKYIVWHVLLWHKWSLAMFYIPPICQKLLYRK